MEVAERDAPWERRRAPPDLSLWTLRWSQIRYGGGARDTRGRRRNTLPSTRTSHVAVVTLFFVGPVMLHTATETVCKISASFSFCSLRCAAQQLSMRTSRAAA